MRSDPAGRQACARVEDEDVGRDTIAPMVAGASGALECNGLCTCKSSAVDGRRRHPQACTRLVLLTSLPRGLAETPSIWNDKPST
jgi:hypothetical protein